MQIREVWACSLPKEATAPCPKAETVKSFSILAGIAMLVTAGVGGTLAARAPAAAATPPPTPPPIGTPPSPSPNATLVPLGGASPAPPSPSPPPNARKGLEGVWEVQLQHPNGTDYTHFNLAQQGNNLSGTYLDTRNRRYPLTGSIEGSAVRMIVTLPDGTTLLLEGKLDGTTDMIGTLSTAGNEVFFTASYRPKEKWIENINPSPAGVPSSGGYTPP